MPDADIPAGYSTDETVRRVRLRELLIEHLAIMIVRRYRLRLATTKTVDTANDLQSASPSTTRAEDADDSQSQK